MLHKALQNKWARVLIAVFATFLYALGVNLFVVPMGLYSGGVVGLSQIIRTLLAQAVELPAGVDIAGILYFLINIPVLYLAWRDLGRAFLIRTLICVGASSLFLSVIQSPTVPILDDPLASCLVGGILCGFALGLALTCGCSTGGLDVVGLCLTKRGSRFTVGRFSLGFNIVLYVACALLFDIQTAIYSVIYTVLLAFHRPRTPAEHQCAGAHLHKGRRPRAPAQHHVAPWPRRDVLGGQGRIYGERHARAVRLRLEV